MHGATVWIAASVPAASAGAIVGDEVGGFGSV